MKHTSMLSALRRGAQTERVGARRTSAFVISPTGSRVRSISRAPSM